MIGAFKDYVANYDLTNDKINTKFNHSIRVMNLSKKYAKKLGFNNQDIKIASQIGLLHDIGRFEQIRIYNTYNDSESVDHADLGVKILFRDNVISKFDIDKNGYQLIKVAIKNHNKYAIESGLSEKELLHAKLIRNMDKIDILYIYSSLIELTTTEDEISPLVLKKIKNNECVQNDDRRNINDQIASYFAFCFDIYNQECLDEAKKYVTKIYEKLNHKEKFTEIYNLVIRYIDERKNENAR